METYRIYFEEREQGEVLRILGHYGGVQINDVSHNSIDIGIDRPDGDEFYEKLMEQLEREVYDSSPQYRYV